MLFHQSLGSLFLIEARAIVSDGAKKKKTNCSDFTKNSETSKKGVNNERSFFLSFCYFSFLS